MTAGQPNWQKLAEMGKLPKSQRSKVPYLGQLDDSKKELDRIKDGVCDECRIKLFPIEKKEEGPDTFRAKCTVENCDYTVNGRTEAIANNNLRLHMRSHPVIVPPPAHAPEEKS